MPHSFYNDRIENFTKTSKKLQRQINMTSLFRLLSFILAIAAAAILYKYGLIWSIVSFIALFSLFLFSVSRYSDLVWKKKYHSELININKNEIRRLNWDYASFDPGREFIQSGHPYMGDLDIFGEGSLFQYMNATCTSAGKAKLAGLLISPAGEKQILQNQSAVLELKEKAGWRQSYQARGNMIPENGEELNDIKEWLEAPETFSLSPFLQATLYGLPAITIITLILSIFLIPFNIPVFFLLLQLGIIAAYLSKINKEYANISRKSRLLNKYRILLELIENELFKSKKLVDLKESIINPSPVSAQMKKLAVILSHFDWRLNMLMGIVLNAVLLWDLQCIRRLKKWKKEHGHRVSGWFDVLAEFDSLSSLGGFAFNNPGYTFPALKNREKLLSVMDTGHPLIPEDERIGNDLDIDQWGQMILVTGSNMSGKSTFLRTVGVNLILAMAGAPVCAKKFDFQPVEVFTSMRVGDSLYNRESTFYAELRRLKSIIDHYKQGKRALILLDEILKGTNSKDKHFGSEMLIRQLIEYNAAGIIATHDLELSKLENEFTNNLLNYSFEVEIEQGQFNFDYKLKRGVCKTLNATELMKQMGISVTRDR